MDSGRFRRGMRRAGSALFAFGARSLQSVTTLVLTLLAARFLSPAEYGVYTLSILFVTFLQTLVYTGFFHYAIRAKGDDAEIVDTCFWLTLALSGLGSALLFVAAPSIAAAFNAQEISPVLRLLALTQPVVALTAWCTSVLMRQGRMRLHFSILLVQNVISLAMGIAVLVAWKSVYALVAYRLIRAVSGALLYLFFSKVRPGLRASRSTARDAFLFSQGLYGTRVLTFISNYGADLALGLMFSTAESGLYRFGNRIATGAIDIVTQPMRSFAMTQFGAAYRADSGMGPVVERFSSATLILAGGVAGTIVVFGADLVRLYFRPEYMGALVVTYALAVRALFGLGSSFVEPVLAASGQTGKVVKFFGIWTTIQTVTIPLFAVFGLGALAWSRAAIAFCTSWAGLRLISRASGVTIRPVIGVMLRAIAFVLTYTALAAVIRLGMLWQFGSDQTSVIAGVIASGLVGLVLLIVTVYARSLDLRVFSG